MEHDAGKRPVRVTDSLDAPVRDRGHHPAVRRVAGKGVQFIGRKLRPVGKERIRLSDRIVVIPISHAGRRAPPCTRQRACIPAQIPRTGTRMSSSHENSCTCMAKWLSFNAVPHRMIPSAHSRFLLVTPEKCASRHSCPAHETILATGPTNSAREREQAFHERSTRRIILPPARHASPAGVPGNSHTLFPTQEPRSFLQREAHPRPASGTSPPSPVRVIRSNHTYLLQVNKSLTVDLPSQPVRGERCGKDAGDDGPEAGGDQTLSCSAPGPCTRAG